MITELTEQDSPHVVRLAATSGTFNPVEIQCVKELLDAYRDRHDFRTVQELATMDCDCKRTWRLSLVGDQQAPLHERLAATYEVIGRSVLGEQWWTEHGGHVRQSIRLEGAGTSVHSS